MLKIALSLLVLLMATPRAFAYTNDWSNTSPIDHVLNSLWPTKIRDAKTDVSERLDSMFYGFTAGETSEGVKSLRFIDQVSNPSTVTDVMQLYGKAVGGKTELFFRDEDGNSVQVTSAGALNVTSQCSAMWPVGSVFISVVSTNPATLLGCGTWSAFAAGRILVGLDSGDTDFDTVEETGGAKTATISQANLPSYNLSATAYYANSGSSTGFQGTSGTGSSPSATSVPSGGSGSAMSIMNPYIAVYMWKRTS